MSLSRCVQPTVATLITVLVLSWSFAALPLPAHAAGAPADCPLAATEDDPLTTESDFAAQELAQACDVTVEVLAEASETTKVFALPSGDFEFESWAEPQWAERDGSWVEVDTTLVVGDDGIVRPVASTADVAFSAGGDGPFATMTGAGGHFSLAWPDPLPPGVLDGNMITYPEVYQGVDLVVRAERGGFSHLLVVKTPDAAQNPAVREAGYLVGGSAELTEVNGGLVISGPEGVLAAAPPAEAWDSAPPPPALEGLEAPGGAIVDDHARSSARGPGDAATMAPVDVRVGDGVLTVAVDGDLLDTAHYPVFIDPTYDKKWATWAPVNSSRPSTQWTSGTSWPREVARVGSNPESYSDLWRAHFRFDTKVLKGKRLTGTTSVDAYLIHTGWCAGEQISIWQTSSIGTNTPTWNGMSSKWLHGGALQTKTGKANTGTCGQSNNWMKYSGSKIGQHVQRHADHPYDSITFGFRMATESGGHWAKFDPAKVLLKATYQYKPHSPVAIRSSPGGNCNKTSPGPWINNRTPTLYGKASDGDGTVKVEFNASGPTSPATHTSAWTNSGAERGWKTPTLSEGNYRWRVRGTDTVDTTSWTAYCYFRLDHTGPSTPVVERVSDTPVVGEPVTLRFTSTDARSGVKRFAYGIGVDAKESFKSSSGTTTITFTPEAGRTVVYVWAEDNAGNSSSRTAFNFFTGRITEAEPRAAWRLDGDPLDDSGHGHDLVLGTGVGYGPDRSGHAGAALTLDGTGCAEAEPVIRTDSELTLSAWVKLADKDGYHTVLQQVGSVSYAVSLHYADTVDRWRLTVTDGEDPEKSYMILNSDTSPPVGVWQHLAGTVDPVASIMRLYIDGELVGERAIPSPLWNAQGRFLVGCAGSATSTWQPMTGAIDHVGVWQGLLSDAQIARAASELPAGLVGDWQMRGDGADGTDFGRDIAVPDDVSWVDDQFGRVESAIRLDGTQCLDTGVPVVRTDESFTVAAWAKAEVADEQLTLLMQPGQVRSGFKLLRGSGNQWLFSMASVDADGESWFNVGSPQPAKLDTWQHVVGVYDATAAEVRLYVDGVLQGATVADHAGWDTAGPLVVGCTASIDGFQQAYLTGAISDARAWRGALTSAEVAAVHGGNPPVTVRALWPLDGPASDAPTYLTDVSGNGHDLSIDGDYAWVRDRGFGREGALGLELADNSCAETAGPTVATDASFTVTAWVLLEATTDHHTVVSQAAQQRAGFYLKYEPGADRWKFELPSTGGSGSPVWHSTVSSQPPELGTWTHLAGVYDVAAGKVRLYVDGELQDEADGPATPWMATGSTLIGCAGDTAGGRWAPLGGVVDDVRIWTSTLDPDRISDLAAG